MEKLLPQNIEAECGVLGSIIIDPEAIVQVSDFLQPEDFYRDAHRTIYEVIIHLYQSGEPADFITICDELARRDRIEDVGGASYISSLINEVPTSGNVEYYGRIVERTSTLRRLIGAAGQIAAVAYEESDADLALDKAEHLIYEISQRHSHSDFASIEDILAAYMTRLEQLNAHRGTIVGVPTGFTDLDRMTGGLQRSDLIVLAARPGIGKCLTAHTLIDHPATGERLTIEQCVQRRLPVIYGLCTQATIRVAEVHGWIDSGRQPCYRVRTRTGREVEVTEHHPFLAERGWTPLYDLQIGESIALPRRLPTFGHDDNWPLASVRLLAYFLTQGGTIDGLPGFTSADPASGADFAQVLTLSHPTCVHTSIGSTCRVREPGQISEMGSLAHWLSTLGLLGRADQEKFLPGCVWQWDRPRLAELLRTLMGGPASTQEGSELEFRTTSRQLAADIQHAFVRFGIVSTLAHPCPACWCVQVLQQDREIYQIEIGGSGSHRSATPVPEGRSASLWAGAREPGVALCAGPQPVQSGSPVGVLQRPESPLLASPDIYWDAIAAIEPVGLQQVYDLTVPDGQNFIAQDIFVHNTSLALSLAHNAAVRYKKAVAIFSLEMSKEQLAQRLLSMDAGIDQHRMRTGWIEDDEWERIISANDKLSESSLWIDDTAGISTMEMRSKARRLQTEHGVDLLIVDYLQLMQSASTGRHDNRVQEVSEISRSLKGLARELNVPVLALAQLSRSVESRQSKVPQLSDLRESGCITGESLLYLPDSGTYQPIARLIGQQGFRVLALNTETWQLEPDEVTHAFATGRKPVHRLTTSLGRSIRATANHRFLTRTGWQRLDQLLVGMDLALPRWLPGPMQPAQSKARPTLALQAEPADQLVTVRASPTARRERLSRPDLPDLGCSPLAWPELCADEPGIPARVFAQSREGIAHVLRHLWAIGGQAPWQEPERPLAYLTPSQRQARDAQSLLLRFGIQARLTQHAAQRSEQAQFQVQIESQADMACFLACIAAPEQSAMQLPVSLSGPAGVVAETDHQGDVYWDRIQSIEVDGEEEVYDLTVDKSHNFIANDLILHNSIEQDSDIVLFIYREDVYNPDSERKNIANLILAKHRNGPVGEISLYFQPSQTRFRDLDITETEA